MKHERLEPSVDRKTSRPSIRNGYSLQISAGQCLRSHATEVHEQPASMTDRGTWLEFSFHGLSKAGNMKVLEVF